MRGFTSMVVSMVASLGLAVAAQAGIYEELTPEQQKKVQAGEQVFVTKEVAGKPWPKAYVFQRVDAAPEEVAAVFADYASHKTFLPDLRRSTVRKIAARVTEVDYTLKSSIISEDYTVRNTLSAPEAGSYRVDWAFVRAETTKFIEGNIRFEPLGTGTIMAYYNFVVPGMAGSGLFEGKAMKQVRETARAIGNRVVADRGGDRARLDAQIQALRAELAAER